MKNNQKPGVIFTPVRLQKNEDLETLLVSRESAAKLWPALINAMHSDKQSVDDLLRDIGIKMNRYYQVSVCLCLYVLSDFDSLSVSVSLCLCVCVSMCVCVCGCVCVCVCMRKDRRMYIVRLFLKCTAT